MRSIWSGRRPSSKGAPRCASPGGVLTSKSHDASCSRRGEISAAVAGWGQAGGEAARPFFVAVCGLFTRLCPRFTDSVYVGSPLYTDFCGLFMRLCPRFADFVSLGLPFYIDFCGLFTRLCPRFVDFVYVDPPLYIDFCGLFPRLWPRFVDSVYVGLPLYIDFRGLFTWLRPRFADPVFIDVLLSVAPFGGLFYVSSLAVRVSALILIAPTVARRKHRCVRRGGAWVQDLRTRVSAHLLESFVALRALIELVELSPVTRDKFTWRFTPDGRYSPSSAYRLQFAGSVQTAFVQLIWKPWDTLRCRLFVWIFIQNRLMTADRLLARGWPNGCPLCMRNLETATHLFTECPFSRQVWDRVPIIATAPSLAPSSWVDHHRTIDWMAG
ncbi:hypothetical protein QYE76_058423 [Lolium multiflorum]|uniref:Reverse transcriptase zinc-binding domain-containing protein n=1 Tax=Lolium multiflorum TaxID=4521 RepID=A0AAD8T684_LOLMU|nr:hypothetical protein QYE76_058423 [Lolium multiflorum]